ncbi:MAG: PorP/SprF family type IX secretion system membrane protein [Marinoscillum sp.]
MSRTLLTLIFGLIGWCGLSQDIQYSQYYSNPLYLNPAFTGAIQNHRVAVNHRLQWPNLPKAFANYSFSYDFNAASLNSGFGILVNVDRAGSANLKNTSAAFNYSYSVNFEDRWVVKPAVSFGYVTRNIDYEKLVFGDQIDFGIPGAPTQDPSVTAIKNNDFFEVGSGLLVYNRRFWGGISAYHINQPNNSLIQGPGYLPMKLTAHAGMRFEMGNKAFKDIKKASVAPSFIYKIQGEFQQLDVGASFHYAPVLMGLYYRGIPWANDVNDYANHDAIILIFGVEFNQMQFGYSFDSNISRLGSASGGAHEVSLIYLFNIQKDPRKVERSKRFLPCPAFSDQLFN